VAKAYGTSVEIAPLGRFGEPLDEIFDKRLFLRAAFAFDDDSPRDADRVPQLLDRLLEADDLGPKTARELINCLPFIASLRGFHAIAAPVEGLDKVLHFFARGVDGCYGGRLRFLRPAVDASGEPAMIGSAVERHHIIPPKKSHALLHTTVILTRMAHNSFKSRKGARQGQKNPLVNIPFTLIVHIAAGGAREPLEAACPQKS
jgi:hypothetical protein